MQKISLITVGGHKEKFYKDAEKEYLKRLSSFCTFEIFETKEYSALEGNAKLLKESEEIIKHLNKLKDSLVCLLDINGKQISSEEMSNILKTAKLDSQIKNLVFVIGGSNGVHESVKRAASQKISFGKITLPHQLCRVVLVEQVYRGFTIEAGGSYHK
ncbi:MAG: 23S rRNA (pseudouridine(1915)-N(3))-methyltransferase RlmH [Firmicutes bacterium]|nr:23S rRNA (pseudouridine(1915)-N(3))-methyltransferase RlmH [Bacillota bacterium]MCL2770839.1 23S rRNA (pseudouridine(1915)-N(3))-methyltransferase RlmH [Bacillota bacterium]